MRATGSDVGRAAAAQRLRLAAPAYRAGGRDCGGRADYAQHDGRSEFGVSWGCRGTLALATNGPRTHRVADAAERARAAGHDHPKRTERGSRATISDAEVAKDRARAARDAALRIRDRILKEQDTLRAELTTLNDEQARLQGDNAALEENNAELSLANESLAERNTRLSAQNAEIQGTFNDLQTQVVTLNEEPQALRVRSEREAQNLRDTLAQFEAASGSELTYRQNEIVYSDLIAAQNITAISAALQEFVAGAQGAVIGGGASDVELSTDQLNSLIGAVAATPGEDLVVPLAADNFVGGARVLVNVEAYVNQELPAGATYHQPPGSIPAAAARRSAARASAPRSPA